MALLTTLLAPNVPPLQAALRDKHHERKHGSQAYYGQP
jgi:ribulose-5-phosphate 4-epimerase/fuculose-1-phosphate aldolase